MDEIFKLILKSLGVSDAVLTSLDEAIKDPEKKKTFDIKTITDPIVENQRILFENDPNVVAKYASAERGKLMEQIDRRLKQAFGVSVEELNGKTIEDKITFSKSHYDKTVSKSGNELQNENIQLKNEIKDLREKTIPEIESRVGLMQKNFKIENLIRGSINPEEVVGKIDGIMPGLTSFIQSKYEIDVDENGNLTIMTKDKLQPRNEDGTKILKPGDIINGYIENMGFKKKSNANDDDEGNTQRVVVTKKEAVRSFTSPHLKTAEENLVTIKKK